MVAILIGVMGVRTFLPNKCDKTINVNANKTQSQRVQEGTNILKMMFGKKQELAIAA